MKKLLIILLACVLLVAVCSGCQKEEVTGNTTLNIAYANELTILDPFYTASAVDLYATYFIYDGLFNILPDNSFEPLVAESWDISEDGIIYSFHIRSGIKFHNGAELNAGDVVYSFQRAAESPFMDMLTMPIDRVEAEGNTVKVYLKEANASFMQALASVFFIYEDEYTIAADAAGTMAEGAMGCGAYALDSFNGADGVTLKAFEDYYLGAPSIKEVNMRVIPDASTALIALENGEVDYIDYAPSSAIEGLKSSDKIDVSIFPYYKTITAVLNNKIEPLDDQRVRQAINYATDREFMVQVCEEGYGTPATSLINEVIFGYSDGIKGYSHDIEKAKSLLAEAGYPGGQGFPTLTIDCIESYKNHATSLQANLKEIGINTEVNMLELNAMMNKAMNAENEIVLFGIEFGRDASFYENMVGTEAIFNWSHHSIPGVDERFKQALLSTNSDERLRLYTEIMNIVNEDGSFVSLYFPQTVLTTAKGLQVETYWTKIQPKGKDIQWQ